MTGVDWKRATCHEQLSSWRDWSIDGGGGRCRAARKDMSQSGDRHELRKRDPGHGALTFENSETSEFSETREPNETREPRVF